MIQKMNQVRLLLLVLVVLIGCSTENIMASGSKEVSTSSAAINSGETRDNTDSIQEIGDTQNDTERNTMIIQIGERKLTATLEENSSTEALKSILLNNPITIEMQDYGNMEKVGRLGTSLPRNDESITTKPGDLILYQGNSFVIYYDTNAWNFTKLGTIENMTQQELKDVLGKGSVTVTLSLDTVE